MQDDMRSGHRRRWGAMIGASALVSGLVVVASPGMAVADGHGHTHGPGADHGTAAVVGTTWGDRTADRAALGRHGEHAESLDAGSLFTVTHAVGARAVWERKDRAGRAITGQGVTVAVLDSGVEEVPGLAGKTVQGPDLSLESGGDGLADDTYGHGTHMAGIIAARDDVPVDRRTGAPRSTDPGAQLGVAPDAQVLALKLAATDGSTDVSQVIAALDWVAQHQDDNGMDVRVVNLSFGTDSVQPYQIDPLAAAAEHAWRSGLVVVVSGGNDGEDAGALSNPAIDPYVIAVGASDPNGAATGWSAPSVADFSSRGTDERHVDLVAPGASIVSLRAPDSFVDTEHPEGRVAGDDTGRLFRGSGTSQAAAVVSGAAALVLQANPALTPDGVKHALVSTARPLAGEAAVDAGAGQVDISAAVRAAEKVKAHGAPVVQTWPQASGLGSLDAARGGSRLVDPGTGDVLVGEIDVFGAPWDPTAWAQASSSGTAWDGGEWMRARWSGDAWTSDGWARARWSDASWDRARWSRARWSDASWDRARWSRARWSDASWERARWSSVPWS
ncbi:S8 family serine peptidase [Cellulomonas sp. ATA003]|uniref:S8 family serine peptidase n=1 Tax=Cellulomonas sp. ATA003 TaxID=3073064 RepID=UPI0028730B00|nr:S8 family serine peptidase [Cellulomonas sp. ATA003]WNB87183.1 S8 family serine peptidase [Cellulomonas sp. ATA003]